MLKTCPFVLPVIMPSSSHQTPELSASTPLTPILGGKQGTQRGCAPLHAPMGDTGESRLFCHSRKGGNPGTTNHTVSWPCFHPLCPPLLLRRIFDLGGRAKNLGTPQTPGPPQADTLLCHSCESRNPGVWRRVPPSTPPLDQSPCIPLWRRGNKNQRRGAAPLCTPHCAYPLPRPERITVYHSPIKPHVPFWR